MGTKRDPGPHDCYAKAGDDEPIFTLRAKDPIAAGIVRQWASWARSRGVDPVKVEEAFACAIAMERWTP